MDFGILLRRLQDLVLLNMTGGDSIHSSKATTSNVEDETHLEDMSARLWVIVNSLIINRFQALGRPETYFKEDCLLRACPSHTGPIDYDKSAVPAILPVAPVSPRPARADVSVSQSELASLMRKLLAAIGELTQASKTKIVPKPINTFFPIFFLY